MSKEKGSCLLIVRVSPRASRSEIMALMPDGSIKVRLKAPPAEGKANAELVVLFSRLFKVPASSVRIVAGLTSRLKSVRVDGTSQPEATRIVARALESSGRNG